ncbi:multiheme c-type cytochrome [Kistimonas asteriae]|uniref:multiheme c-type cytochrome n=1 Tax=Kistimonas asteriae TaxID=517724 RepID=UPI001BA51ED1|nr:multiheme c-type cytochrome [Kistimonas asteriae]
MDITCSASRNASLLVCLLLPVLLLFSTGLSAESVKQAATPDNADYVGSQACASCHQEAFTDWQTSDHSQSMQPATEDTILGNFDHAELTYNGVTSRFYQRDGQFFVRTDNEDGELQEYPVSYTFGFDPLQQYLIQQPDGRLQALSIAWDSRPEKQGGQRWFHLYPDDAIDAASPLHWTKAFQNANSRCVDCHTTNLQKHYDSQNNTFSTTWSDVNVACEACHGPGSGHLKAVKSTHNTEEEKALIYSNILRLTNKNRWVHTPDSDTAHNLNTESGQQVDTCASCHALRANIAPIQPGNHFLDQFQLRFLEPGYYQPDGQIDGEVFVYGSFLQSKMHQKGVVCSDCHNPHSGKLKIAGNQLCTTCHKADVFDTEQHSRHPLDSEGAQCVSCHMPSKNFMVVDPRRDHSFSIPRPDLSVDLDTTNACTTCHTDKTDQWAANIVKNHWQVDLSQHPSPAKAFASARDRHPERVTELRYVVANEALADIVRATALHLLANETETDNRQLAQHYLKHPSPLMRIAAVRVLETSANQEYRPLLDALKDPIKAVRIEAARALMPLHPQLVRSGHADLINPAIEEYKHTQRLNSDMPNAQLNLADIALAQNNPIAAEAAWQLAIKQAPDYGPAYINLADYFRRSHDDTQARRILEDFLSRVDDYAPAYYALGLLEYRQQQNDKALIKLQRAYQLDPHTFNHAIAYVLILEKVGRTQDAIQVIDEVESLYPENATLNNLHSRLTQ